MVPIYSARAKVGATKGGSVGESSRRAAKHRAGQDSPVPPGSDRAPFTWAAADGTNPIPRVTDTAPADPATSSSPGRDPRGRPLRIATTIAVISLTISMLLSVSGLLDETSSQAVDDLAQLLAGLSAAGACWWSWRRSVKPDRLWRLLLALGTTGWSFGQAVWSYYQVFEHLELPSPSLADVGYFSLPILALPALWVFPARGGHRPVGTAARIGQLASRPFFRIVFVLDSLVVVGSLFLLTWATSLGAAIATRDTHLPVFLVALGYPVTDLMLVVFVVLLGRFRQPRNPGALALFGLGIICISVSDSFFLYLVSTGAPSMPPIFNIGFQVGPALLALGALVPQPAVAKTDPNRRRSTERGLVLLPYLPLTITGLLVIGQLATGSQIDNVETFVGFGLVILVVLRQFVTLVDNVRLLRHLRQSQDLLSAQAFNDSLTGLANRALFRDRLDHAVEVHRSDGHPLGLIFCDLDDFKLVNDGLGHAAGDELLKAVATRLLDCVQPTDTVARLGGDEFAVLLEGAPHSAELIAERILAELCQPFLLRDGNNEATSVRVGVSIGVTITDPDEPPISPDGLMARVDAAMYAAKRRGKSQLVTFRPDMSDETSSGLLGDLRVLLATKRADPLMRAGGSIDVMYQPVVGLYTNRMVALEALVRWQHPRHGLLSAELLLTAAEDAGMLGALEEQVLDTACRDIRLLRRSPGLHDLCVHVNLSGQRTGDPRLVTTVQDTLERHGLPGQALILEITETGRVPDVAAAAAVLSRIRALDVRLALDDFGAGFSGLSYLLQLPIDIVKLDRSLTTAEPDSRGAAIRNAAATLILGLGLELIAEGVETEAQVLQLADLGCRLGQGFLYSKPRFLAELEFASRYIDE
jgi:diguanylate cyclase (GGDEF)-like protein